METLFAWAETPGNPLETPSETLQQTLLENLSKSSRLHQIMYGRRHSGANVISLAFCKTVEGCIQNHICNITQNSNREQTAVCQDLPVWGSPEHVPSCRAARTLFSSPAKDGEQKAKHAQRRPLKLQAVSFGFYKLRHALWKAFTQSFHTVVRVNVLCDTAKALAELGLCFFPRLRRTRHM